MAQLSESQLATIEDHPIESALDSFRDAFRLNYPDVDESDRFEPNERSLVLKLILTLLGHPAALNLSLDRTTLFGSALAHLYARLLSNETDVKHTTQLIKDVVTGEDDVKIWTTVYNLIRQTQPAPRIHPLSTIPTPVTGPTAPSTPPPRPAQLSQTPSRASTGSIMNSSEFRKDVDEMLKQKLGPIYVGVPGFYEAFFGRVSGLESAARMVLDKCKKGRYPLYSEKSGWRDWPEDTGQNQVLSWFAELSDRLASFAKQRGPSPETQRRPLAQPNTPLDGSTVDRKLDVGFVDDPKACKTSKYHWSQILVPEELKRSLGLDTAASTWLHLGTYAREVLAAQDTRRFVLGFTLCGPIMRLWEFDRAGCIASKPFNINKDGLRFVSVVLGFLRMDDQQLGFDPTVVKSEGKRYIEITRNGQTERLILDELINRSGCVVGRATTCWKAHREGDESRSPLVIKDSWQHPQRGEEGELLREATDKEAVNVARYYHHGTVRIGEEEDDIRDNIRKGLDVTEADNYQREHSRTLTALDQVQNGVSQGGTASRKRSSSHTGVSLPPSKRTRSDSSTIAVASPFENRVHRRVIMQDYGKPIHKASSRVALLAAIEGCIRGHQSLHEEAKILQRDVSMNNLMINEDNNNLSWKSFLIDLDLAIREEREDASEAQSKTGTLAFMAIGVLLGEEHSFMHDLESFFWVLFWICVHYDGPGKGRVVDQFEKWNYMNTEELGRMKLGIVAHKGFFQRTLTDHFTEYYRPLIPWVNELQNAVFPNGGIWEREESKLYSRMMDILREAREDPTVGGP